MSLILISGDRLQHAVSRATEAVERGEKISVKLSNSVAILRERLRRAQNEARGGDGQGNRNRTGN